MGRTWLIKRSPLNKKTGENDISLPFKSFYMFYFACVSLIFIFIQYFVFSYPPPPPLNINVISQSQFDYQHYYDYYWKNVTYKKNFNANNTFKIDIKFVVSTTVTRSNYQLCGIPRGYCSARLFLCLFCTQVCCSQDKCDELFSAQTIQNGKHTASCQEAWHGRPP